MNILRVGSITAGGNIILVTTDSGATVYAVSGGKVVSGVAVGGVAKLKVKAGSWRVWAEKDGQQTSEVEVIVTDSYYKEMSFAMPLSSLAVGSLVSAKVNGAARSFIKVHQGLPSSIYDSSCNGTWLLMKDVYEPMKWDKTNNDYANSDVHAYLNGSFLGLFDSKVQAIIKQVKIPYRAGSGTGKTASNGANGLSTKAFLLNTTEVNLDLGSNFQPTGEGAVLSYFASCVNGADSKRIANYNGSPYGWWLRTPYCYSNATQAIYIYYDNGAGNMAPVTTASGIGIRPTIILPSDALVNPTPNADGSYTLMV